MSSPCRFDHVTVYDGPDFDSPQVYTACGSDIPYGVISSGHELLVEFFSGTSVRHMGFTARYQMQPYLTG